jgi:hypothetical protein
MLVRRGRPSTSTQMSAQFTKVAIVVLKADSIQLLPQHRDSIHDKLVGCDGTSCFHCENKAAPLGH